jgi:solute carrier family 35 protein F5
VSSFVVQNILTTFHGPFFLTYFANSLFVIQLPIILIYRYYFNRRAPNDSNSLSDTEYAVLESTSPPSTLKPRASCKEYIKGMYHWPTFRAAIIVLPFWFLANGLYNISLAHTSVTSNTVISATSGMFTFAIAVRAGQEKFSWWKIAGVACSIGGTVLTAVADTVPRGDNNITSTGTSPSSLVSKAIPNTLLGDLICFLAAFFYGMYTTAIHGYLPSVDKTNLFFGYLGALGFVVCSPIVIILHLTNIENLSHISSRALLLIALKGLFDNVLSDTLWAIAMKWTSPTVATLGLALTIPCSIFATLLVGRGLPTWLSASGALFMLVGFVCVNVPGSKDATDDGMNGNIDIKKEEVRTDGEKVGGSTFDEL